MSMYSFIRSFVLLTVAIVMQVMSGSAVRAQERESNVLESHFGLTTDLTQAVTDLRGCVVDASNGQAIEGAVVVVRMTVLQGITDSGGLYRIVNMENPDKPNFQVSLEPGSYNVEVRAKGYRPYIEEVTVSSGVTEIANFTLEPGYETNFVRVAPSRRYFQTEDGNILPICSYHHQIVGHPFCLEWNPTRGPKNWNYSPGIGRAYAKYLQEQGINMIKIILEEAYILEYDNRIGLFQDPVGIYNPEVVGFWDMFFDWADDAGLKIYICFYHMDQVVRNWTKHPFSANQGGPGPADQVDATWYTSPAFRRMHYRDFCYVIDRWGQRDCIFALDLMGEANMHCGGSPQQLLDWQRDLYPRIREYAINRWGKCHMLTMIGGDSPSQLHPGLFFNNPNLDFYALNLYSGSVANPVLPNNGGVDVINPALLVNERVRLALDTMKKPFPFLITETGPIGVVQGIHHSLDDYCIVDGQPSSVADDEYFHNMTWAHFASGGSGSPTRWGFREESSDEEECFLTDSMRRDLFSLNQFQQCIDLNTFQSHNIDGNLELDVNESRGARGSVPKAFLMGAADEWQGIAWVLRDRDPMPSDPTPTALDLTLIVHNRAQGTYDVKLYDTRQATTVAEYEISVGEEQNLRIPIPALEEDIALAFQRQGDQNAPDDSGNDNDTYWGQLEPGWVYVSSFDGPVGLGSELFPHGRWEVYVGNDTNAVSECVIDSLASAPATQASFASLRWSFHSKSNTWVALCMYPTGLDHNYMDLSEYDSIAFYIKAFRQSKVEVLWRGMAVNGTDETYAGHLLEVDTDWKHVVVPLSGPQWGWSGRVQPSDLRLDQSQISATTFFVRPQDESNVFWIDEITLHRSNP